MITGAEAGRVILVGAGPGDPDLLTLRGVQALERADVVLHDALAPRELLDLARASAERIDVGKRGHEDSPYTQEEINNLLIERAGRGETVVRLKGGDAFVFGRGGEELSACVEAGIPFEIVPGVSAALAAPAYAGIPLTDRRHAASFAVVTGHKDPTRVSEATRWKELGTAVDTLVILMGMRNLESLAQRLMEGGKPADTPAAAVMNGSLGSQRVVRAPLGEIAHAVEAAGLAAPVAIVVGSVAGLHDSLAWWELQPLFARRVLVPRAKEQAAELLSALRRAGAVPVHVPLLSIEVPEDTGPLDAAIDDMESYDGWVFASRNAVRAVVERARERGRLPALQRSGARALCVGPGTAKAALSAGLDLRLALAEGRGAAGLLAAICEAMPPEGRRFLIPKSDIGRRVLPDGLRAAGAHVDEVEAYRTARPPTDPEALEGPLAAGEIDAIVFTSPSTVRNLFDGLGVAARAGAEAAIKAAIGETTAEALRAEGLSADLVPERATVQDLVHALEQHVARRRREDRGERKQDEQEERR